MACVRCRAARSDFKEPVAVGFMLVLMGVLYRKEKVPMLRCWVSRPVVFMFMPVAYPVRLRCIIALGYNSIAVESIYSM